MKNLFPIFLLIIFLSSCAVGKNYNPSEKYSPQQLQEDYHLFRNILEESHPSLYWYTPKDSVDYYFEIGESKLKDSLTETKFRYVLSYVLAQIHCGHTSVQASKAATKYAQHTRMIGFPLNVKAWPDTVMVTSNLNRNDIVLVHGVILKSINGRPIQTIIDTFFKHLSADGYNLTHKYQSLSNPNVFRTMYASIYGLRPKFPVEYIDTLGNEKTTIANWYFPVVDTTKRIVPIVRPSKKERKMLERLAQRNMRIDTTLNTAYMEVNTFGKHNHLRSFFRRSFKELRKEKIKNLVVDMRGNGGGSVTLSNLLTKYIADKPFKIADSLYAVRSKSHYGKYIQNNFADRLLFVFFTHKKSDGHY